MFFYPQLVVCSIVELLLHRSGFLLVTSQLAEYWLPIGQKDAVSVRHMYRHDFVNILKYFTNCDVIISI